MSRLASPLAAIGLVLAVPGGRPGPPPVRKRHPHALRIQGYTDSIGTVPYNLGLSRRRANAVLRALRQSLGPGAPPMTAVGYGEADPAASNTNPDGSDNPRGRALNRRVEIHYLG